jgi:tripartite-type tricarboxylate transporter receptor subunit TctC
MGPADFAKFITAEQKRWGQVVRNANLTAD